MSQYTVAVIVGSLRKESFNARLARALEKLAPADIKFQYVRIDDLPLYDQDDDAQPAPEVQRMKNEVKAAHGVLFLTPEYNRSMPGVLKNVLDHGSRPYGQGVWTGKPAAIAGISPGATGTCMAQQHLRNVLCYLDMPLLVQPELYLQMKEEFFDADGGIGNAGTRTFLQGWMDRFAAWVKQHAQ
jgi:chromate reductase